MGLNNEKENNLEMSMIDFIICTIVNRIGNIWGNMQLMERPSRLRWSFNSTSDWKPLFGRNFSPPSLPSIQPAELNITSADPRAAKQLRERLERTLR